MPLEGKSGGDAINVRKFVKRLQFASFDGVRKIDRDELDRQAGETIEHLTGSLFAALDPHPVGDLAKGSRPTRKCQFAFALLHSVTDRLCAYRDRTRQSRSGQSHPERSFPSFFQPMFALASLGDRIVALARST
jgi:hypothetical protein